MSEDRPNRESLGHKLVTDQVELVDSRQEASDLTKELGELINKLDAVEQKTIGRQLVEGAVLQVENLNGLASEHLNLEAKVAMARKATTLVVNEGGKLYQCFFLAKTVKNSDVKRGVEEICRDLNALGRAGLIHSCLAPVSSLALIKLPGKELSSVVFSYVLVPSVQAASELVYNKVGEGHTSDSKMDDLELPEGEFFAIERISLAMTSLQGKTAPSDSGQIHGRIQQYLALLPKGTEVLSITRCAITDLSVPYEIRFRNPLMQKFKQVELDYVRDCAVIGEKLEQFNRCLGIRYTRRDGLEDCSERFQFVKPASQGPKVIV